MFLSILVKPKPGIIFITIYWCVIMEQNITATVFYIQFILFCDHKLRALEPQVWYLKLPTYCTRQTEPFMVWNEQSSSVCFVLPSRWEKTNKNKKIRCGSIVTIGKTHTTMTTENNNNVNNTNTHEHRVQKRMFLISNFFFYCSIVTIQCECLSAAVCFVSWAQSKHGICTVNRAEK